MKVCLTGGMLWCYLTVVILLNMDDVFLKGQSGPNSAYVGVYFWLSPKKRKMSIQLVPPEARNGHSMSFIILNTRLSRVVTHRGTSLAI